MMPLPSRSAAGSQGESQVEKPTEVPEFQELVECPAEEAERVGFDLPAFCNLCLQLLLRLKSGEAKTCCSRTISYCRARGFEGNLRATLVFSAR